MGTSDTTNTLSTNESEVLVVLQRCQDPVATSSEVAEELDVTRQYAHRILTELHEAGEIERKEVGARAVIWWVDSD